MTERPLMLSERGVGGEARGEGASLHTRHGPSCRLAALGKVVGDGRAQFRPPASLCLLRAAVPAPSPAAPYRTALLITPAQPRTAFCLWTSRIASICYRLR